MLTKKAPKFPKDVLAFFRRTGSEGGKIGGKRRLETMTAEQRSAGARKAAAKSAEVRTAKAAKKRASAKKKPALPKGE